MTISKWVRGILLLFSIFYCYNTFSGDRAQYNQKMSATISVDSANLNPLTEHSVRRVPPSIRVVVLDESDPILWPNHTVFYSLQRASNAAKVAFHGARKHIEARTSVYFVERPAYQPSRNVTDDYIDIVSVAGKRNCSYSTVGKGSGQEKMMLSSDCHQGDVLHELMHVLGVFHEHQRPDRDVYVHIFPPLQRLADFAILPTIDTSLPYDYESITHAHQYIQARDSSKQALIEHPKWALSAGDIIKLNRLYPDQGPVRLSPANVAIRQGETVPTISLLSDRYFQLEGYQAQGVYWQLFPRHGNNWRLWIHPKECFTGMGYLRLQLRFNSHQTQWLTLPIEIADEASQFCHIQFPVSRSGQLVSRNSRQCLEVLDDSYSGFWRHSDHLSLGMRACRAGVAEQIWEHKSDGSIMNSAYADKCLGKIDNQGNPVADDERSYAVLQECDRLESQQWLYDQQKLKNKADKRLVLMQANGTVVTEHDVSRYDNHYLWHWQ